MPANQHVQVGDLKERVQTLSELSVSLQVEETFKACFDDRLIELDRVKTVPKLFALEVLGVASSEKQIPQIVENIKKCGELKEPLEPDGMRPRQVRWRKPNGYADCG